MIIIKMSKFSILIKLALKVYINTLVKRNRVNVVYLVFLLGLLKKTSFYISFKINKPIKD